MSDFNNKWKDGGKNGVWNLTDDGDGSFKFVLKEGNRVELKHESVAMFTHQWYMFKTYIEEDTQVPLEGDHWLILAQWHGNPDRFRGEPWRSPCVALEIIRGKWQVAVRYEPREIATDTSPNYQKYIFGPVKKGVDVQWEFHFLWDYDRGYLKVAKDGVVEVDELRPMGYNDARGPYPKIGIYCNAPHPKPISLFIKEYDNVEGKDGWETPPPEPVEKYKTIPMTDMDGYVLDKLIYKKQ